MSTTGNNNDASASDSKITINLTLTAAPSSPRLPLTLSLTTTPSQLRQLIAEQSKIPLSLLRLIFRGRMIADNDEKSVVAEFKIEDGSVIHCMGKPAETITQSTAPVHATTNTTAVSATAGSSVSVPVALASGSETATPSADPTDPLQVALATLRTSNTLAVYLTAVTTLEKIISNIMSHPMEEKYRNVKKQNAAFQRRLGGLQGGDAAMKAFGFTTQNSQVGEESYVMVPSADAWPQLVANKAAISQAVTSATSAASPTGTASPFSVPSSAGFGQPRPGAPVGAGNIPPGMEGALANMMSNPAQLQAMLQNPMVRQMMDRDPRFANNPQLRQQMEQMAANPDMVNQISQMMQDPNMQRQMQTMMQDPNMQNAMNSGTMPSGLDGMPPSMNDIMSNPAQLQAMLQNPMVRQMMDRDPRFANNPQLRQQMEQMAANPDMVNQISQMMQDPNMQRQMQTMMQDPNMQNAMNSGTMPFAPGSNTSNNSAAGTATTTTDAQRGSATPQTGRSDEEMTEEEMIAEAIARSMRET